MSDPDLDLLRRFARDHAQDAFTEIVRRHVNLVYSAALRQVRSPQLAEDVAQSVFCDLARNANKLCAPDGSLILTAWLYQVTHHTAVDEVRKESRRQLREQIAAELNVMNAESANWNQIEPFLDEAMQELDPADRTAILLRYFENKSLRQVGEELGVSDDAAQKRVSRSVERLKEFFSKRKVTIGASGLVTIVSANAVQAAPAGLAATISSTVVLGGAGIAASTAVATTKTIAMTALQKTLVTATIAALAGTGFYEAHQAGKLQDQVQKLRTQQAPLTKQIHQLQRDRDNATNQLASLLQENARLKSNSKEDELLKLRAEVTQLSNSANKLKNLKMKVSELEGRWFNVTNAPQYSMPYLPRGKWKIYGHDPLEVLLSAATAATKDDHAKISELTSSTNSQSLFSKKRWDDVKGIQIVSTDYVNNNGQESAIVNTILMKESHAPTEPDQPQSLKDLIDSHPVMCRWHFLKTKGHWEITGSD